MSTAERRQTSSSRNVLLNRLSMSQKYAVNSLTQYGYQFAFSRNTDEGNLAILMCGNNIATVDAQGDIDTSPQITIRD
ncbi:hypothetical protein HII17_11945 [Thalassotalea sp. M1531]|uniref:Uncharacterized protein n=1 Tax=Thalassotalea algicola TaxID=2716224 RepID=A0A7Y0Q7U8_9GAMM|nr:hypothetical protein [Thalassotalea algicola]